MTTRDHGRILCKIWQDKDFRALQRSAQAMYMQLLSQPGVNNAGVLPLQVPKWVKGCDELTSEQVWADLAVLSAAGFIVVDEDSFEVLIRSFIRNDGGMAHKYIFKNALRCAEAVESGQIRTALAIELLRLRRADATATANILTPSAMDSNAEVIPSESHSEPIDIPSESEMAFEPDSDHSGVGEGEGVGESSLVGHLGGDARASSNGTDTTSPPPRCPKHINDEKPPNCGQCADARRARERSDADRARTAAAAKSAEKHRAAEDQARAIAECGMCQKTGGYVGTVVCDHDPERFERAQRGIALARAAITKPKEASDA